MRIAESKEARNKTSVHSFTYDRIHLMMISLMHDKLYRLFVNPYRLLYAAGIKAGQKALEIGFGPGFFTIPAAKIMGERGTVYALDINRAAVETMLHKVKQDRLSNVKVILADARETGLPDNTFDIAFLFGVIHDFPDVPAVMREMHRVLTPKGILSLQRSSRSERKLMDEITRNGLFAFREESDGILKFSKGEK
jgi:ubiquinone/menaquinone biosynthesis C-methylase UbiE